MATAQAPQVSSLPPPPPPQTAPHQWRPRQMTWTPRGTAHFVGTMALFATIAIFVSLGLAWFSYSAVGDGHAGVASFFPGNQAWTQGHFTNGTGAAYETYVDLGLVHVGEVYAVLLGLVLLAGIVTLVAAGLSFARGFGWLRSVTMDRVHLLTVFLAFALTLAAVLLVPLAQPWAYNTDVSQLGSQCGPTPNPCTSVWGTQTVAGVTLSWGLDAGWFVALVGLVLLFFGLLVVLVNRRTVYSP